MGITAMLSGSETLSNQCSLESAGNALILGTGGSSRAVSYALKKLGFKVTLVSRSKKQGILCYQDLNSAIFERTDLIVNTTPLGMSPDIQTKPDIDYNLLKKRHVLFDLVYNPEITSFLKLGQERGCKIITGLKMLHSQAERSWEIWNDRILTLTPGNHQPPDSNRDG